MKVKLINFPDKWPAEYKIIHDPQDEDEDPAWFTFMDETETVEVVKTFQLSQAPIDNNGVVDYNLRESVTWLSNTELYNTVNARSGVFCNRHAKAELTASKKRVGE